jgi:CRISPR-associated exonuclease Cas4
MQITGTLIQYYFFCHRQLWLHANDIKMEAGFDLVELGNLVQEESYNQRPEKYEQIEIGPIKIDFFDTKNKIIHEIKKSSKFHETHIWQVKYYIYIFEQHGIEGVTGILEYPKERKTVEVFLSQPDRERIEELKQEINRVIFMEECPKVLNSNKCKNCSYYDFCYASETDEP